LNATNRKEGVDMSSKTQVSPPIGGWKGKTSALEPGGAVYFWWKDQQILRRARRERKYPPTYRSTRQFDDSPEAAQRRAWREEHRMRERENGRAL
jgi:hypothetical protein